MKKYLLGLFAIMLAITLNAFTTVEKKSEKNLNDLHWYKTNTAGTVLQSYLGEIPREEIEGLTDCNDLDEDFCARGYVTTQSLGAATIPSDDQFMEKP
jgi:hypothetical protein